jgi:hypothetical protein
MSTIYLMLLLVAIVLAAVAYTYLLNVVREFKLLLGYKKYRFLKKSYSESFGEKSKYVDSWHKSDADAFEYSRKLNHNHVMEILPTTRTLK